MYSLNVFGAKLEPCGHDPVTGFYRDGLCNTGPDDSGSHTVCCVMSLEFLEFSKNMGNDLSTPRQDYEFKGLKPGDKWCLCALRWEEARQAGCAPLVVLESTNIKSLELVELEHLKKYRYGN